MKKKNQLVKTGAMLLALTMLLGGCSKRSVSEVDTIRENGVLQVAIVDTKSQYTSVTEGKPAGIEPDLAQYIAEALGVEAGYQICDKKKALEAVSSGEADIALGCINSSASLNSDYLFTFSYGKGYVYVVTKNGDYALTAGSFSDSSIGLERSLNEETRSRFYEIEGIQISDYSSAEDASKAILAGSIRAYVCYENQAKQLLENPELQIQQIASLEPEEFVIVTGKNSQTLVNGINTLIRQFLEEK